MLILNVPLDRLDWRTRTAFNIGSRALLIHPGGYNHVSRSGFARAQVAGDLTPPAEAPEPAPAALEAQTAVTDIPGFRHRCTR